MVPELRQLGFKGYLQTWQDMQCFTEQRDAETQDEIWIVEHPPVYTLGLKGNRQHILSAGEIPVVQTDRGGQVTYHGLGQLVIYVLLDIARLRLSVRQLVTILEQAAIDSLAQYGLHAVARADAPGVYIDEKKIASVGLRIKKGRCYHGLSINNQMDLSPFRNINPCGYPELEVTQLIELGVKINTMELAVPVIHSIIQALY